MYGHSCKDQRMMSAIVPQPPSAFCCYLFFLLDRVPNSTRAHQEGWLASEFQGSTFLGLSSTRITDMHPQIILHVCSRAQIDVRMLTKAVLDWFSQLNLPYVSLLSWHPNLGYSSIPPPPHTHSCKFVNLPSRDAENGWTHSVDLWGWEQEMQSKSWNEAKAHIMYVF